MNIFDDRIYIFGDDSRQLALFNLFLEKGYNAAYSTDCFSNDNKKSNTLTTFMKTTYAPELIS